MRRRAAAQRGFTLLEVMIALVIGMIGLIGTIAVQQAMLNATQMANDGAIAQRLASQQMEQFDMALTNIGPPIIDRLAVFATNTWNNTYVDASGVTSATPTATARWLRQWRVTNTGANLPYKITVIVQYSLDTGAPKTVRIDNWRWKTW